MPFYSLYKSELLELASFLKIPTLKIPTNSLPTYQGLTYDKLDPVLYLLTEKQLKVEEIHQQFNIDVDCNSPDSRIIDLLWLKKLKIHIDKQLFQTTPSQFII